MLNGEFTRTHFYSHERKMKEKADLQHFVFNFEFVFGRRKDVEIYHFSRLNYLFNLVFQLKLNLVKK